MLIYGLKLAILAGFSLCVAAAFNRKLFFDGVGRKALLFWLAVLPFVFLLRNELVIMLACMVILFLFNRGHPPIISVVFFIVTMSAVPDWLEHRLSLPGINYVMRLSYDKVVVIAVLLPVFVSLLSTNTRVKWNLTDTFVCLFVLYTTLLSLREGKVTTLIRFFVESSLIYIIPYFVVSRVVRTIKDLHYCSLAFLILAILIAAVFMISQVVQTDLYEALNPRSRYNILREYRGGFLRLSGPLIGLLVGFLVLAGYFSLEILKRYNLVSRFMSLCIIATFVLSILFGGSRGALFGVVLGLGSYFYFAKLTGIKRTIVCAVVVVLLLLEFVFDVSSVLAYKDEYGTFDYRANLYETSWEYLKIYPFFGSHTYMYSGFFDHLVTGLGIIDIVSGYLEVALLYGFVGLFIFVGMFLSVVIPLLKRLFSFRDFDSDQAKYTAAYFSLNVTMMFLILTTSMVSFIPVYLMVTLAIGRVLAANHQLANS